MAGSSNTSWVATVEDVRWVLRSLLDSSEDDNDNDNDNDVSAHGSGSKAAPTLGKRGKPATEAAPPLRTSKRHRRHN